MPISLPLERDEPSEKLCGHGIDLGEDLDPYFRKLLSPLRGRGYLECQRTLEHGRFRPGNGEIGTFFRSIAVCSQEDWMKPRKLSRASTSIESR